PTNQFSLALSQKVHPAIGASFLSWRVRPTRQRFEPSSCGFAACLFWPYGRSFVAVRAKLAETSAGFLSWHGHHVARRRARLQQQAARTVGEVASRSRTQRVAGS